MTAAVDARRDGTPEAGRGGPLLPGGKGEAWAGGGNPGSSTLARIGRAYEHQFLLYRRTWRGSVFNSFLGPALFLLAMGVGLGGYVDRSGGAAGVPYLAFLAPGLLAASVMQTASFEATFPILGGLIWTKRYHAMHAGPIEPGEIAVAQILWGATRITLVGLIFVLVMAAFGAVRSPLVVLAIPAATLTGLAFATPIAAFSATQKTMMKFNYLFRFGITPLFLFSGTFFPVENLPAAIQPIAWLTPLYHGVALCRGLALGTITTDLAAAAVHLAVLSAFAVVGMVACIVTFRRRLET